MKESTPEMASAARLARLNHDLAGPVAIFAGFLDELHGAVELLAQERTPVPVEAVDRLLDEDFRPCLACLDDALARLRATLSALETDGEPRDTGSVQDPRDTG